MEKTKTDYNDSQENFWNTLIRERGNKKDGKT